MSFVATPDDLRRQRQMEGMGNNQPGLPGVMRGMFGNTGAMPAQNAPTQAAQPRKGEGLRRAAGIFSDFAAGLAGQQARYAPMLEQRRQAADAETAHQRQRAEAFTDWQQREDYQRENPMPSTAQPYRWESNDGDVYQLDPATGQPARVFDDPTPRLVVGPDGRYYPMNPGAPTAPVGGLRPVGAPQAPNIGNTPAPQLNASGNPTRLTRAQYQAVAAVRGQAETDAWAQRNNIVVGE